MANPGIKELQNPDNFELIAELTHNQIKEFVISQLSDNGKIVSVFMIYQITMLLAGFIFITRSVALLLHGETTPFLISIASIIFSFTILVIIHELLHGIALKFTGARKINFGGYLKKFIFYAEADSHVLNRRQFVLLSLTPLFVVKIISIIGIILFWHHPALYFFVIVMSVHSLFCAGDVGLLSIFYQYKNTEIFMFDVKEKKTSYFYKKI